MTAELELRHTMPAPAEVAFDVATDAQQLGRWLPQEQADAEVQSQGYQVDKETLSASWGNKAYQGRLVVVDGNAGESEVRVHLSFSGEVPADAEAVLGTALEELGREVLTRVYDAS